MCKYEYNELKIISKIVGMIPISGIFISISNEPITIDGRIKIRQFKTEVQRLEVFPGGTHKDILVFTTTIGYPDEIHPSYLFRERSAICTA
jgi:hypothetical protein